MSVAMLHVSKLNDSIGAMSVAMLHVRKLNECAC